MADFSKTLIVAIVASIVAVIAAFGLIYYLALNWTKLLRRGKPDPWDKDAEKSWPKPRKSGEANVSFSSSPASSPRSSRMGDDPVTGSSSSSKLQEPINGGGSEPITPPRNAKL
ncbi:uncharacterized protein GGS25DRAFT_317699 [Hypoxylon fragiforme]|uniref:uncharacterized protein n=1 Tax=Hypoxylon fragiforme TaxID=63214 RepID=UPI0020C6214C|nr:uncharacterized protein GGS25DRAFT_317699 [Hypoxylon fragiforme]KAI2607078.1 hypothetical protein GGS25DRAFT_317699 [Hypoxylon fragiforme]